jgi:predicted MFS family arabinose efflux permease
LNVGAEIPASRPSVQHREQPKTPLVWRLIIAYGAVGIGYIIPATYLPIMAREILDSPLLFGWSWPIFGAAAFVSTLMAARFQQRFSNQQVWVVCQIVMASGLLLPVLYPHITTIIAAGICVGGTFMIITMMGIKEVHRIAPPEDVMRHIAIMTASFATGQMIGPVFASSVYSVTQSFAVSLITTSVVLFVTAIFLMRGAPIKAGV